MKAFSFLARLFSFEADEKKTIIKEIFSRKVDRRGTLLKMVQMVNLLKNGDYKTVSFLIFSEKWKNLKTQKVFFCCKFSRKGRF